ncbi:MAG: class I SAM-dependent methyltransferase [Nanoarchaeota archaeon]
MEENEYKAMYEVEEKHAWFRAKREMMIDLFSRFGNNGSAILDIGCGTGVIASFFAQKNQVIGLDISATALRYAKMRDKTLKLVKGDAQNVKFKPETFDWVFASDVIEHVKDDYKAMQNIHNVLKPGGKILITVPALEFLWGKDDDLVHHQRRYTKKQLKQLLSASGFKIEFLNYWDILMFPAVVIYKLLNKSQTVAELTPLANKLAYAILKADTKLIQHIPVPFGVSLVAIATKR